VVKANIVPLWPRYISFNLFYYFSCIKTWQKQRCAFHHARCSYAVWCRFSS